MQAELVWILDLTAREEELLAQMRKTTRYSIRKAQSERVEIEISSDYQDGQKFYPLYLKTVSRHKFVPFSQDYIRKEFESFVRGGRAFWVFGSFNKELINGAMIIRANGSAFYHHGASLQKYPSIPVSYLVQWEAIKEAKRRGCGYYNFWGIAPEDQPNHPWVGLTLFKKGFGGFSEEYLHAQDLVLSPKYWFTYLFEKFRRAKRHL